MTTAPKIVRPRDLVGAAEAAEMLGLTVRGLWSRRTSPAETYVERVAFPPPITTLRAGPIWTRKQIESYARAWTAARA